MTSFDAFPDRQGTALTLGYARVSTLDQNPLLQIAALEKWGCDKIYPEYASGSRSDRPELNKLLENLRRGDTLVVWKLDRLGRNLRHLLQLTAELEARGIAFACVEQKLDTSTPSGRFFFVIMAGIAELEREMNRERTMAGLRVAWAEGKHSGRPPKLTSRDLSKAKALMRDPTVTMTEVAARLGVSRATLYRHLAATDVA